MKINRRWSAIILITALIITGSFLGARLVQAESLAQMPPPNQAAPERSVTVNGVGEVQVTPDRAAIRLGVQNEAESAEQALSENNSRIQAVIDSLTNAGISAENIQTESIRLSPRYEFDEESQSRTLVGYQASNRLSIQSDDLDALGEILDQAVSAGANTIDSIRFEVSDPLEQVEQARQAAVENARAKAEQLASLTGAILGPVQTIHETGQTPRPAAETVEFAAAAEAVPVQPGSQSISAEVQITWTLIVTNQQAGQPGAAGAVAVAPASGPVGTEVEVVATGFPANTNVEIGVGPWGSEYEVVQNSDTDADGQLVTQVTIPDLAQSDEEWVVVVAVDQPLGLKATSNRFMVTD